MLSLAKAAKDYYLQKLGELSPREDYYLRGGTASGVWRGSGASELGLEGTRKGWCGCLMVSIRRRGRSWVGGCGRMGWRRGM